MTSKAAEDVLPSSVDPTRADKNDEAVDMDNREVKGEEEEKLDSSPPSRKRPIEDDDKGDHITPITTDGDMPQKRYYRQRAHCNPLSHNTNFKYPVHPDKMDWSEHYPMLQQQQQHQTANDVKERTSPKAPTVLDIGCGFGGLTLALATLLPNEMILGMEIRAKVTEYVRLRIVASRKEHPGKYQNCSVMRTNSMKYLPHYFPKASLKKLFFCFPDPHFKRKNHGRRIVSERLLSEYAYVLQPGGRLYCITDVKELHEWHMKECLGHYLFRQIGDDDLANDPSVDAMRTETEEGKKVQRAGGSKYYAVFERIQDSEAKKLSVENFFPDDQDENDDGDGADDGGDDE